MVVIEIFCFSFLNNNPELLALNRGGTLLTNSNLKIWYPMNDGHRGQQSYILDASNTGLCDDVIVNGDFSDASVTSTWTGSEEANLVGWANSGTHNANNKFTISNSECTLISDGTLVNIFQNSLISGVTYKVSVNIKMRRIIYWWENKMSETE